MSQGDGLGGFVWNGKASQPRGTAHAKREGEDMVWSGNSSGSVGLEHEEEVGNEAGMGCRFRMGPARLRSCGSDMGWVLGGRIEEITAWQALGEYLDLAE